MNQAAYEDRQLGRAARLLAQHPMLTNERDRRALIVAAGFGSLLPIVDLSGPPISATTGLLDVVRKQSRLEDGRLPFAAFLTAVAVIIGGTIGDEITTIVKELGEVTPVPSPVVEVQPSAMQEKIIGQNTLRPFDFLRQGARAGEAVARLTVPMGGGLQFGTGFLARPGLLVTNNHVLPDEEASRGAVAEFNLEAGLSAAGSPRLYRLAPSRYFVSDTQADITVVAIEAASDAETFVTLAKAAPAVGDRVNIIQHPQGGPKQVSLQDNRVTYCDHLRVQYRTATLPGSSGSPVFNDSWEVVAVHRAGGHLQRSDEDDLVFTNEGALYVLLDALLP